MLNIVKISVLSLVLALWVITPEKTQTIQPAPVLEQVEVKETPIPKLLPGLITICTCESIGKATGTPTHWAKNGSVLRGKINPEDIGICQINNHYHGKTATKMGLNIFKLEDNITYANYLYQTQGSQPWNWSRGCWGNYVK